MTISQIKKGLHKTSKALEFINEAARIIRHSNGDIVMISAIIITRVHLKTVIVRLIEALPNGEISHAALYNECKSIAPGSPNNFMGAIDNKTAAAGDRE